MKDSIMKLISALPLVVALSFSATAFAQSDGTKSTDEKAMQGMDMKSGMKMNGMDMDDCMHMKGMKGMDMKGMGDMEMKNMSPKKCKEMMSKMKKDKSTPHAQMHEADGIVKNIDAAGKVTLQHGPVKTLGWPAMSMGFAVKNKTLMDKLAVGSKVHVEFSKQGSDYVITSVK